MIYLTYDVGNNYTLYPEDEQPPAPLRLEIKDTGDVTDNLAALLSQLFVAHTSTGFELMLKPYWMTLHGTYNSDSKTFLGFDNARAAVVEEFLKDKIEAEQLALIVELQSEQTLTGSSTIVFKRDDSLSNGTDYFDVLVNACKNSQAEFETLGFSLCETRPDEIVFKSVARLVVRPAYATSSHLDFS